MREAVPIGVPHVDMASGMVGVVAVDNHVDSRAWEAKPLENPPPDVWRSKATCIEIENGASKASKLSE